MSNSRSSTTVNARQLRSIGHRLKPVVTVAQRGFTDTIRDEINRALVDHELIKISVRRGSRPERKAVIEEICLACNAELIQSIGNVALLYRHSEKPYPRLSNLLRKLD